MTDHWYQISFFPRVGQWFREGFRADEENDVEPFIARPGWRKIAVEIGRQCGRIHKGNSFIFCLSRKRVSATVPVDVFERLVADGVIDEQGKIQPDPRD